MTIFALDKPGSHCSPELASPRIHNPKKFQIKIYGNKTSEEPKGRVKDTMLIHMVVLKIR